MPPIKLTDSNVKAATAQTARREIADAIVPGLYLVVQTTGRKSWAVRYRVDRRTVKFTVGKYPRIALRDARDEARKVLQKVASGTDPALEKKRTTQGNGSNTVDGFAAIFIASQQAKKRRSWKEQDRILKRDVLPSWHGRFLQNITPHHVQYLIDSKAETAPIMANRLLALLKRFFNVARSRHLITSSPAAYIEKPATEESRERYLSDEELKALWSALAVTGWPFEQILKVLALTGQRRDEVAGMRWLELDFKTGVWTIPGERTKNGKAHRLPLGQATLTYIRGLPRIGESPLVFPAQRVASANYSFFSGFSKLKAELDGRLDFKEHWIINDLRRTARSNFPKLKIAREVSERILNHLSETQGGVEGTYDRFKYEEPMRKALTAWEKRLLLIVSS